MSYNFKIFNSRILYLIPIVFSLIIILRISFSHYEIKKQESSFAKNNAQVLRSYAMANRQYYQKVFVKHGIKLDDKTIQLLPAYSSTPISTQFSRENFFKISVKTVSDKARNFANNADEDEIEIINYFRKNKSQEEYFSGENKNYYQYGYALRINNVCLKCHGKKENAPKYVQTNYNTGFDYELGDVRGIISIKIPKTIMSGYFLNSFINSVLYDLILLVFLSIFIAYLFKRSKVINIELEQEVVEKTRELKQSFITDRLTLLPNRHKLMEDIKKSEANSNRHLALLNIDRFKDINDFYGHATGDEVLIKLSKKLLDFSEKEGFHLYKLPSDEFAVFVTDELTEGEFFRKIKKIIIHISETRIEVGEISVFLTLGCGTVSNRSSLMVKADIALQVVKKGNEHIVAYSDDMDITQNITKNIDGLNILKCAVKSEFVKPFFQPIYNVKTKKIDKYESLIRIIKKDGEAILPYQFLDIAKKSKIYHRLTKIMIEKSFEYFKDKDYEFSINLSIEDITNYRTVEFIVQKVESYENAKNVVFEILETEKINNYAQIKSFIEKVKPYGCKIAIDDFGSGYSNFAHILELQVDYIKIDSSLVKNVLYDDNSQKIIKTIVDFGKNLGVEIIAEYVEDKESLELLEKIGVDYIQGYSIGKPAADIL